MTKAFGSFRRRGQTGDAAFYGEVTPDGQSVRALERAFWLDQPAGQPGEVYLLADLEISIPVAPSKLLAVGRNYHAHAKERGHDAPTSPLTWAKAPSSLLAHGGAIELPYPEHKVDFEAELCIVIGRLAKNVAVEAADDFIFGYTLGLDISDRDIQDSEKQFYRAKSFDTFTPIGPFVYSGVDAGSMAITLRQNGELRQNGNTGEMIFSPREIVSFLSQGTTLLPGDVIMTGTPAGVAPIKDGDRLEARLGAFPPLIATVRDAAP